jgi:hypothetical protein
MLGALALCLLVASHAMPAAAYDPGKPVSNKTASGGGGGGGGTDHKVALGVAMPYGRDVSALDAFTASIGGRTPAMWAIWVTWGSSANAFPTALSQALRSRNVTPMIWWAPAHESDPDDPTFARHRNITDGDHDAYIRQFAREARDYGGTVLLRFAHEMNGSYFPWAVGKFDNTASTFIAAWRHIHAIFQAEGAANVKLVWSVSRQACPGDCNPYAQFWPGDAYVDVMGFSAYNWGTFGGKNWAEMYALYRPMVIDLTSISSKPIIVAETGSTDLGGDKAAWIRDGYREVHERLPQISGIVYLNADLRDLGHPDWRLASPAAALAAYAEIAALPEFSATSVFSGRRNISARDVRSDRDGKDRDRKDRQTAPEANDRKDRGPRVQQGAESDRQSDAGEDKATGTKNRRGKDQEPWDEAPATGADTFSR